MTVREFFDLCALRGCDGVVIVNEIADDFTRGNIVDVIDHEPRILKFRHTFYDFERLYGFDREILGFGVSNWNGFEGVYIRMKLKGVSSDYDALLGHYIVTVDEKKYVSYLHDETNEYDYFKPLESEVNDMEPKEMFVKLLGSLMSGIYRLNIKEFEYLKMENGEEYVIVSFDDGNQESICVTGDSELAIMQDVVRHFS